MKRDTRTQTVSILDKCNTIQLYKKKFEKKLKLGRDPRETK